MLDIEYQVAGTLLADPGHAAPFAWALGYLCGLLLAGKDGAPGALERLRRLLESHDRLIAQLPRCGCEHCAYLRDATEELAKLLRMEEAADSCWCSEHKTYTADVKGHCTAECQK